MAARTGMINGPTSMISIPLDREVKNHARNAAIIQFALWFVLSMWIGTEIIALGLHSDKHFANQLISWPFYNPYAMIYPWGNLLFLNYPSNVTNQMHLILYSAWAVFAGGSIFSLTRAMKTHKYKIVNAKRAHDYDGSSHWSTRLEIGAADLLSPDHPAAVESMKIKLLDKKKIKTITKEELKNATKALEVQAKKWRETPGIYVGQYRDPDTGKVSWLRDTTNKHVIIAAPTRSGKGVGIVVPAALSWSGSLVVNDPKAELFALTSHFRKNILKQNVFKFEPLATDGSSCRINVLDFVRLRTEHENADVENIAKMICDPQGMGLDTGSDSDHWKKTAVALMSGVILHVLYSREIRNKSLAGCDAFLSNPDKSMKKVFQEMLAYEHDPQLVRHWLTNEEKPTKTCPAVAMSARDMLDRPEGEAGSVMSSAKSYLALYRNPIIAKNIETSDFSIEDLMYSDKAATLYLVNTPNSMENTRPLMRLIVNVIMTTFTGDIEFDEKNRPKAKFKHPMLMVMDEFTSTLGKMSIFANAISFVAGYGIKILIVIQDLVQLYDIYGDKGGQAITANMHIQVWYATNNHDTASHLSKMLGQQTIRQETRSWNGGKSSRSESYKGRSLMDPSEIQSMPETHEIIMVTNHAPIYAEKIVYYREDFFNKRASGGPRLEKSDTIPREHQMFYKMLRISEEEALVAAQYRRDKAIIASDIIDQKTTTTKKIVKGFADMIEPPSDDDSNDLFGIV